MDAKNKATFTWAKNAFYIELLGNGLLMSANYDVRVANRFGIRAGLGYVGSVSVELTLY